MFCDMISPHNLFKIKQRHLGQVAASRMLRAQAQAVAKELKKAAAEGGSWAMDRISLVGWQHCDFGLMSDCVKLQLPALLFVFLHLGEGYAVPMLCS